MKALLILLFGAWLSLASMAAPAQTAKVEVIDLRFRNAEEVLPVLRPFLEPGGTMSALQNRLIVRTSSANLAELRRILDSIDKQPRQLIVTVTEDEELALRENGLMIGGTVGGDGARIEAPLPGETTARRGVGARVYRSESVGTGRAGRSVRVTEGQTAFVAIGQTRPSSTTTIPTYRGPIVIQSGTMRTSGSGFEVRPRVSGDRVILDIAVRGDRAGRLPGGAQEISRLETVVTGRLGEWIDIGGAAQQRTEENSGLTARSSDAGLDTRRWFLRVDEP
jgi:hypothetical protein